MEGFKYLDFWFGKKLNNFGKGIKIHSNDILTNF